MKSDFSFNPTVPKLTYSVNNTLNDITFAPVTSIDDNIIEGNETIIVSILPGGDRSNDPNDHNVQVELEWQTATITIIDNDSKYITHCSIQIIMSINYSLYSWCAVIRERNI